MADRFHLFDSVLPSQFGQYHYGIIKECLRGMVHAKLSPSFDQSYFNASNVLRTQGRTNTTRLHEELEKFKNEKESYSRCILDLVPGSGKDSSSATESNYSLALST
eukprot:13697935-Ditylum_brightwellii.AAC.1